MVGEWNGGGDGLLVDNFVFLTSRDGSFSRFFSFPSLLVERDTDLRELHHFIVFIASLEYGSLVAVKLWSYL